MKVLIVEFTCRMKTSSKQADEEGTVNKHLLSNYQYKLYDKSSRECQRNRKLLAYESS